MTPRPTLYSVLVDGYLKSLALDSEGNVKTAIAIHDETHRTYVLKREWIQRLEAHKAQKAGVYVIQDFLGNNGTTSWSVNVATETELDNVAKANGYDALYPYVYVICQKDMHSLNVNFVKIGCSFNPRERMKTLQTGNPYKLELYAYFKTSNKKGDIASMYTKERLVHKELERFGGPYESMAPLSKHLIMNSYSEWFFVKTNLDLETIRDTVERIASVDASETQRAQKRSHCDISEDSDV